MHSTPGMESCRSWHWLRWTQRSYGSLPTRDALWWLCALSNSAVLVGLPSHAPCWLWPGALAAQGWAWQGLAGGVRSKWGTLGIAELGGVEMLMELAMFSSPLRTRCGRKSFMVIFSYLHIGYGVLWCKARSELLLSVCSDQSGAVW